MKKQLHRRIPQLISRYGSTPVIGIVVLAFAISCLLGMLWSLNQSSSAQQDFPDSSRSIPVGSSMQTYPVTIRRPAGPPRVGTGILDREGIEVTVACATCHAARKPNLENRSAADLNEFHSNLSFSHGNLSCLSCHHPDDYDALKLADGTRVEFSDVTLLCAQCHGPQMREYENGVHGGMNGYWDLTRGPQSKNNCVDCHAAHAPQFPIMKPTFKPRDRFLEKADAHE